MGRQNSVGYQNPITSLMSLGCRSSHSLLPSGMVAEFKMLKVVGQLSCSRHVSMPCGGHEWCDPLLDQF